jgi:hypothetical protein
LYIHTKYNDNDNDNDNMQPIEIPSSESPIDVVKRFLSGGSPGVLYDDYAKRILASGDPDFMDDYIAVYSQRHVIHCTSEEMSEKAFKFLQDYNVIDSPPDAYELRQLSIWHRFNYD